MLYQSLPFSKNKQNLWQGIAASSNGGHDSPSNIRKQAAIDSAFEERPYPPYIISEGL